MSDKQIRVGDLVMIVRTCCGSWVGAPFRVNELRHANGVARCNKCFMAISPSELIAFEGHGPTYHGAPISWLKRLDPDALNDDVPTHEELTA